MRGLSPFAKEQKRILPLIWVVKPKKEKGRIKLEVLIASSHRMKCLGWRLCFGKSFVRVRGPLWRERHYRQMLKVDPIASGSPMNNHHGVIPESLIRVVESPYPLRSCL